MMISSSRSRMRRNTDPIPYVSVRVGTTLRSFPRKREPRDNMRRALGRSPGPPLSRGRTVKPFDLMRGAAARFLLEFGQDFLADAAFHLGVDRLQRLAPRR